MVQPVYKRVRCSRGQTAINTDPVKLVSRAVVHPPASRHTGLIATGYMPLKWGSILLPGMDLDWNLDWTGMGFLFYQL